MKNITFAVLFSSAMLTFTQVTTEEDIQQRNLSRIEYQSVEAKASNEDQLLKTTEEIKSLKQRIISDDIPEVLLISKTSPIQVDFTSNLVENDLPATKVISMNDQAQKALNQLFKDSTASNISDLIIASGYRDINYQRNLFNREMNLYTNTYSEEEAYEKASLAVAPPGTSEHQSGMAVDFLSTTTYRLDNSFAQTPAGTWLMDNAYKYGFILRYPEDKTEITNIMYEPWHYRYVGNVHSEYIYTHHMTLEEYLILLQDEKILYIKSENGQTNEVYYIDDIEEFDFNSSNIEEESIIGISRVNDKSYIVTIELAQS
ncbi:M15 family metallopeptidase [Vallitalea okinawensis]|uniref:M15 family metallopeptidase n=1 Tax=Vallitalea okinawensis TaxID=2078660 RepID=UPI001FA8DFED|nr:M15 family metallopeptidase [Vallitalea okinawensis]